MPTVNAFYFILKFVLSTNHENNINPIGTERYVGTIDANKVTRRTDGCVAVANPRRSLDAAVNTSR